MGVTEAPIQPENLHGFGDRFKSLVTFDKIRITRLLEILQYAFLFTIFAVIVGYFLDKLFFKLYPVDGFKEDSKIKGIGQKAHTILVLALQVMAGAVAIFYMRKIIDLIDPFINLSPDVYIKHRHVNEASGELAIAVAYIGVQTNALKQLEKIRIGDDES